jgi:hypothetical protein
VLELVPGDQLDEVRVELREPLDHRLANRAHVRARFVRREQRKRASLRAPVGEGVVEVVMLGRPEQPELLEVADVSEIPDERRLERGELARQLVVRERLQQSVRSLASVLELRP